MEKLTLPAGKIIIARYDFSQQRENKIQLVHTFSYIETTTPGTVFLFL